MTLTTKKNKTQPSYDNDNNNSNNNNKALTFEALHNLNTQQDTQAPTNNVWMNRASSQTKHWINNYSFSCSYLEMPFWSLYPLKDRKPKPFVC